MDSEEGKPTRSPIHEDRLQPAKRPCTQCGKDTDRTCFTWSKGFTFICSDPCNNSMIYGHAKACGANEKTTADDLLSCITKGLIPQNAQTREDYGFDQCSSPRDQSDLLGVYKTLMIDWYVLPPLLNKWRQEDEMVPRIMDVFMHAMTADINPNRVYPNMSYYFFMTHSELFCGKPTRQSTTGESTEESTEGGSEFWDGLRAFEERRLNKESKKTGGDFEANIRGIFCKK